MWVQSFTPRQMRAIAGPADVCNQAGQTLLREEAAPYAFDSKDARRSKRERLLRCGDSGHSRRLASAWHRRTSLGLHLIVAGRLVCVFTVLSAMKLAKQTLYVGCRS